MGHSILRGAALCLSLLSILAGRAAHAHEFWLEPDNYRPQLAAPVGVSHFVGQNFKGESYPFVQNWFRRYVVADAAGERPVEGVEGDDPAVTLTFTAPGLKILAHHSTPSVLTMEKFAKFESYLREVGRSGIAVLHREQGKPETGIRERYARCAKALISVEGGGGDDRAVGMPLELVAERNPYALAPGAPLPVRLLLRGAPLGNAPIMVFTKGHTDGPVPATTDAEGRAMVPVGAAGIYLLNAVYVEAAEADDDVHWSSLWASLTFARP